MCLKLAERIASKNVEDKVFEKIVNDANDVIWNFPKSLNKFRDIGKFYDVLEGYVLMTENTLINKNITFTEEFISASGVFSEAGRKELEDVILKLSNQECLGIYLCEPYSFLICSLNNNIIIIDTHPVSERVGGNNKSGIVLLFEHKVSNIYTVSAVCNWIWKRLRDSGVKSKASQSLSLIKDGERYLAIGQVSLNGNIKLIFIKL